MIDLFLKSASRPGLIEKTVKSIDNLLVSRNDLRKILHEDVLFKEKSDDIVSNKIIVDFFDEVYCDDPPLGVGKSIEYIIPKIKSDFLIYWEDDFELELPIDIDHVIHVMSKNNISHVSFYKTINKGKDFCFDYLDLTSYNFFAFTPSVWNMKFIRDNWGIFKKALNFKIKQEKNLNILLKKNLNLKTYTYGKSGFPRVVNHIGLDEVVKPWGRGKSGPGKRTGRTKGKASWVN